MPPHTPPRAMPLRTSLRTSFRTAFRTASRPRRLVALAVAPLLAVGLAAGTLAAPAAADDRPVPQGRTIKHYTVQPGDTPSGLAVRFHAWTAELIAHNHLGGPGGLVVGDRIEIPVVTAAARGDRGKGDRGKGSGSAASTSGGSASLDGYGRPRVRREVAAAARRRGVDPQLALAISWQESGWRMHHVSSAGAIGAMQVLPATGRWMEQYAGRDLRLRKVRDNATAGALLLDVLRPMTRSYRHRIGAYYQGPGGLRTHGLYDETRDYVSSVRAIRGRLERGRPPS